MSEHDLTVKTTHVKEIFVEVLRYLVMYASNERNLMSLSDEARGRSLEHP